jgi:hypothetical protein
MRMACLQIHFLDIPSQKEKIPLQFIPKANQTPSQKIYSPKEKKQTEICSFRSAEFRRFCVTGYPWRHQNCQTSTIKTEISVIYGMDRTQKKNIEKAPPTQAKRMATSIRRSTTTSSWRYCS